MNSATAVPTSGVTVPDLGEGILPCGPSTRPRRPTTRIMAGWAMTMSNSVQPPSTFSSTVLWPLANTVSRVTSALSMVRSRSSAVFFSVSAFSASKTP